MDEPAPNCRNCGAVTFDRTADGISGLCRTCAGLHSESDERTKRIVSAAVKRSAMDLETWEGTRLWDQADATTKAWFIGEVRLDDHELPILYTRIDSLNWTLFTTKAVRYRVAGAGGCIPVSQIADHEAGNFKGLKGQSLEHLTITTIDGEVHRCPFETGKPSMGPIYAIRTLTAIRGKTAV